MQNIDKESSTSQSNSNDSSFKLPKNNAISKLKSSRQIHKIPIAIQQSLFAQVFQDGKSIKKVADELKINYSSAKSLIHYYKTNKRPIPNQIADILAGKLPCPHKALNNNYQTYNNLKIEVRLENSRISSYYFFERINSQNHGFPICDIHSHNKI